MIVVRFAALAALVVWLAGLLAVLAGDALRGPTVPLACGAVVLVSLVVLKFVGPPPRAFFLRAGVVAVMLLITIVATIGNVEPRIAVSLTLALGATLLLWYVIE